MKNKTKAQFYREMWPEIIFPQLYSKRGFENRRIKIIIPKNRCDFAIACDIAGNIINL